MRNFNSQQIQSLQSDYDYLIIMKQMDDEIHKKRVNNNNNNNKYNLYKVIMII